jgi:signal transduction histidine kinase
MSTTPRPPLLGRMSPRARTILVWGGAALFPVMLVAVVADGPHHSLLSGPAFTLPLLAMLVPAGLLRRRPLLGLGLMLFGLVAMALLFHPGAAGDPVLVNSWYAQTVAVDAAVGYIAAGHRQRASAIALISAMIIELACAAYSTTAGPAFPATAAFMVLALFVVWLMGRSVAQRRAYGEAQRAQAAVQAVQAERLRIARELHDMIAHSIGVIAIQAGVGSRVIDTQPAEARNSLAVIEDTSRETLAGLRRMLGALRRDEPGPLDPSAGLADLDRLVARSLDAGVRVDVRRSGRPRTLPGDIDMSAYRIIQEAVANVVRHAGADACLVRVDYGDDELSIEVTDEGRGGAIGAGYGIAGMRERVSLLHGEFTAGPRPEGGFRVAARIPAAAVVR